MAVKLITMQVTKLLLYNKTSKIDIISFAKPGLTEDLYVMDKEEFSVTCYVCDKCVLNKGKSYL
jgi:hypothetical protein